MDNSGCVKGVDVPAANAIVRERGGGKCKTGGKKVTKSGHSHGAHFHWPAEVEISWPQNHSGIKRTARAHNLTCHPPRTISPFALNLAPLINQYPLHGPHFWFVNHIEIGALLHIIFPNKNHNIPPPHNSKTQITPFTPLLWSAQLSSSPHNYQIS